MWPKFRNFKTLSNRHKVRNRHFAAKETDLVGWTVKGLKISNDRHTLHAMEKIEKYVQISDVKVSKGEIIRTPWDRGRESNRHSKR